LENPQLDGEASGSGKLPDQPSQHLALAAEV
jgi:hypothetical protein